jgi:hypothetical protein
LTGGRRSAATWEAGGRSAAPDSIGSVRLALVLALVAGAVRPVLARGGGGPRVWTMTLNYCREMVVNKGITDVTRFQQEVSKCVANPVTHPPAYN